MRISGYDQEVESGGHYYDQDYLASPIMERRIGRTIVLSLASFLEKVESHFSTSSERDRRLQARGM